MTIPTVTSKYHMKCLHARPPPKGPKFSNLSLLLLRSMQYVFRGSYSDTANYPTETFPSYVSLPVEGGGYVNAINGLYNTNDISGWSPDTIVSMKHRSETYPLICLVNERDKLQISWFKVFDTYDSDGVKGTTIFFRANNEVQYDTISSWYPKNFDQDPVTNPIASTRWDKSENRYTAVSSGAALSSEYFMGIQLRH